VLIAHRLDVTSRADTAVCCDGRDVQVGRHGQLLAGCPTYRELLAFAAAG
jgi:ABC-type transport system involved in cytochrome bd biosynthesis fused ATPase/permease subunit